MATIINEKVRTLATEVIEDLITKSHTSRRATVKDVVLHINSALSLGNPVQATEQVTPDLIRYLISSGALNGRTRGFHLVKGRFGGVREINFGNGERGAEKKNENVNVEEFQAKVEKRVLRIKNLKELLAKNEAKLENDRALMIKLIRQNNAAVARKAKEDKRVTRQSEHPAANTNQSAEVVGP